MPRTMINEPRISEQYFRCLFIARTILVALEKNTPNKIKGIPSPKEQASKRLNDIAGVVAANVRIVPSIGPTHGVQPAANANPNRKEK